MGKTRKRVTVLVLSLEALGFCMLALAIYLAGELSLSCERADDGVVCQATERRILGLVTWQRRVYGSVIGADIEPPALGRSDHWLVVETVKGRERVLAGSRERTLRDAERLRAFLEGESPDRLESSRSAAPVALGAALFGFAWIALISLIMREFLGYHTPWWWPFGPRSTDRGRG